MTYKVLKNLIQKYQTPFDEIANLAFPKPKVPEPKKEEGVEKEDSETFIKLEKQEVPEVPPYEIPEPLKDFKHPGIFSTMKKKVGLEQADYYLFLRCLSLLEGNKLEKAKEKWRMHHTKGEDRDPKIVINDSKFEAFLEAYKNWSSKNKELSRVRTELGSSKTLADSYNRFMKEQGEKLKEMEEEKLKQLLNMMVGPHAWEYHQSLQKKSQPKKDLKPLEEDLGRAWHGQSL